MLVHRDVRVLGVAVLRRQRVRLAAGAEGRADRGVQRASRHPAARRTPQRHNAIVHWPEDNPGGPHFAAMDQAGPLAADIGAFFAKLR
nr:hypothetical protein GCM10020241_03880 [Streptoalloteichus tenebrarius]